MAQSVAKGGSSCFRDLGLRYGCDCEKDAHETVARPQLATKQSLHCAGCVCAGFGVTSCRAGLQLVVAKLIGTVSDSCEKGGFTA